MATIPSLQRDLKNLVPRNLKDCMQRAVLVVQRQAMKDSPNAKGELRRSHGTRVEQGGKRGVIGVSAPHGRFVHDGTGLYGRHKTRVVPKVKKAMKFNGIVRRSTKGMKGRPWLADALQKSRSEVERELAAWGEDTLGSVR